MLSMAVPFLVMRVLQPLFNFMESRIGRASMTGNVIIFLFMLIVNVSMQCVVGFMVSRPFHRHSLRIDMSMLSFITVVIMELLIWDTILMPLGLAVMGSSCPNSTKFFKMLRTPHECFK